MPNKLSQFWQELKRRNVVRVITVYAGAAFVIIELINNITEPLKLPEWTPTLVIVLLAIGFPIVIIFSWIYDIHPEGGMVKTEPANKVKAEEKPASSNSWKIASYISFMVIAGLIVLNIIPGNRDSEQEEILDKSIAVLPFHNDSPDKENKYFINGTMESIINNLCKIEDLRVISRSTAELYRDTVIYIPDVASKMRVSYVLEGSMQKYGDRIRMSLQLIDLNDNHVWSELYDREIHKVEDMIDIQSEIAQLVAGELQAVITPEERQLIEKIPTSSLTAYDFCQQGIEEHSTFLLDRNNIGALDRAKDFYQKALNSDSLYAEAYALMAFVNFHKHEINQLKNYLDSVLIFADIALSYDDQSTIAYSAKGWYYLYKNQSDQAIKEFDKALIFDPNDFVAFDGKAWNYWCSHNYIGAIDNFQKAISIDRGRDLQFKLRNIGTTYCFAGFLNKAQHYYKEAVKLASDSITYYINRGSSEHYHGNYPKAIEFLNKSYLIDTLHTNVLFWLGFSYMLNDQNEESFEYTAKYIERMSALGQFTPSNINSILVGYYYWKTGNNELANFHFNEGIKKWEEIIRMGNLFSIDDAYMKLSAVYAFMGEENKAFEYLRLLNKKPSMPVFYSLYLKNNPLFNQIRSRPEFQQIVSDVEAKYQAEHERVRQWLEENEML